MPNCNICNSEKPESDFYVRQNGNLYKGCKKCVSNRNAKHQRTVDKKVLGQRMLKYLYGLSSEKYEEILLAQGGGCAICGSKKATKNGRRERLFVDHDHETGKVRGLVCNRCNTFFLGKSTEMIPIFKRIIEYLEK